MLILKYSSIYKYVSKQWKSLSLPALDPSLEVTIASYVVCILPEL